MKALPALRVSDTQGDLRKCQGGGFWELELNARPNQGFGRGACPSRTPSPSWSQVPKKDSENFKEDIPNGTPRGIGPWKLGLGLRKLLPPKINNNQ